MKKTRRNAFTIVELVIVIAVVAILAAVLIPTFTSLVKKAQTSKDTQLIRNLNTTLAVDKATGKEHNTMQDALDAALEGGYDVEKINASNTDNEILWDSINDAFCYLEGKELENNNSNVKYLPEMELKTKAEDLNKYDFWKIYTDTDRNIVTNGSEQTFSIYLGGNDFAAAVAVKVGFDAGKNTNIPSVTYNGETAPKNVIIRTCSANTTLYVTVFEQGQAGTEDYKCDTVNHYDVAGKLVAKNAGMGSYHENGKVFYAEVEKGKVVAEEKAEIEVLFAKNSDVAIFESEGGSIKEAYATSEINHSGNKTLEVLTEEEITTKGEAAKEQATENELVEKELNADTVAYIKNGTTITQYTKLEDAIAAASDNGKFVTKIVVCKDYVITDNEKVLSISNKNIYFLGRGETKPVITGAIYIEHTSGNHSISFENLQFTNDTNKDHLADSSLCSSKDDVNKLTITNCYFYETKAARLLDNEQRSIVAICEKLIKDENDENYWNKKTGTQLIFKNNIVETKDYKDGSSSAYYTVAITTSGNYTNQSYGADIYNYAKHEIVNNQFLGHFHSIIAGGYANINGNVFDGSYYSGIEQKVHEVRAFQLRGTKKDGMQFDVSITNNTFKNLKEIFKLYTEDVMMNSSEVNLELSGSNGFLSNKYENIKDLGTAESKATNMLTNYCIQWDSNGVEWNGIKNPVCTVAMDKINMNISGKLETGFMTLCDGTQVMTYTQAINPSTGRTGYFLEDENKVKYWFFCNAKGSVNYFLKDGTNDLYVAILGGGSDCTSLKVKEINPEPNWITDNEVHSSLTKDKYKYFDGVGSSKVGAIYKSGFSIFANDEISLYNGTATKDNNKITVTATKEGKDLNVFFSTIGSYDRLLVTSNSEVTADNNTLIVIVPDTIGQLVVNGSYDVEIDANIANIDVLGAQNITIKESKEVSGILRINESDKEVVNHGKINKLYLFAKSTVTNNSTIDLLTNGDINPGYKPRLLAVAAKAKGSVITNSGTINTISTKASIELTNNVNATINALTLGFVDAEGYEYAKGSTVINNGKMCQTSGSNINIFAQTTFTNNGTIGVEGRGPSENHAEEGCTKIGGIINIGYYGYSDAHSETVFNNTNNGIIYEGSRHNGTSHQQVTFWVWGVKEGYGKGPRITIKNTGNIYGDNWKSGTTLPAFTETGGLQFNKN